MYFGLPCVQQCQHYITSKVKSFNKKTKKCRDDACKSKGTRWDDACKSKGTRWDDACKSKSPKYPTSAACCDNMQLTKLMWNPLPIPFTTIITQSDCVLQNTDTSSYLQPSITSSDCALQTQLPSAYLQLSTTSSDCVLKNTVTSSYIQLSTTSSDCILLNTDTDLSLVIYNHQLLHRTASSFKPLM